MQASTASKGGFVDLAITGRCNQRCIFCYEEKRGGPGEMSLDEVKRLVREAAATHENIVLCGKEALLRPDILEVIRYGRGLQRRVVAFTNGQVLARPRFVEQLVEAGLTSVAISFHFPDAQVFAQGAQVKPQLFDRVLRGMNRLRDYNAAHPDARLEATVETDLFDLNRGRLIGMRDLLARELGDTFRAYTLGGLTPVNLMGGARRGMLEPLDERRAELAEFVRTHPPHVRLRFTKTALCLIPGHEHLSLEAQYRLSAASIRHNLYDAAEMVDDDQTVCATHDFEPALAGNPYRWVCRTCLLVRLCRSGRSAWYAENFLPTRDQKPHPVTDTTPADVLARWRALEPDAGAMPVDLARIAAPVSVPTPEERLLAPFAAPGDDGLAIADAWLDGRRFLEIELRAPTGGLHLHLGLPEGHRADLGFVVGGYDVVPTGNGVGRDVLRSALERLAAASLPVPDDWADQRGLDLSSSRTLLAAWRRLGRLLWPGTAVAPGWTVEGTRWSDGTAGLRAAGDGGVTLEVAYTPTFRGPHGGPAREVLTVQRRGAADGSTLPPAVRQALLAVFPEAHAVVRGPAVLKGRALDLVVVVEEPHA